MNIDELQSVKSQERQSDTLQQLRASFYEDAGEFIRQLREQREQAAAESDDPFSSPEVQRLTDEIETAERTVEDIYDRRVGKLVKMASFAAADMPTQDDGLTRREQSLFDRLVDAIEENRENVLAVLDGEDPDVPTTNASAETAEAPASADADTDATDEDAGVGAADLMGDPAEAAPDLGSGSEEAPEPPTPEPEEPSAGREESPAGETATADAPDVSEADEPEEPPAPSDMEADGGTTTASRATTARPGATEESPSASTSASAGNGSAEGAETVAEDADASCERTTLRITRDVGEIMCVDERSYDLASEDVVTLPSANAEPLVQKDAAERLD